MTYWGLPKFRYTTILLFIFAFGCSQTSVDDYMQQAQQAIGNQAYNKAVIALKNILQQQPDHIRARKMIGEVYLQVGDGSSAEKEFRRYLEYGGQESEIIYLLAEALFLQYEYKPLLEYLRTKGQQGIDTQVLSARARLRTDELQAARQQLETLLQSHPDDPRVLIALAESDIIQRRSASALARLEKALQQAPDNQLGWYLKGQALMIQSRTAEAATALQRAVRLMNGRIYGEQQLQAQVMLIQALIQNEKLDLAKQHTRTLARFFPKLFITHYYKGLLAFLNQDYDQAEIQFNKVIKTHGTHLPTLLLLGTLHYQKDNFEQANNYLTQYVARTRGNLKARKLLAAVRIKLNRESEALDILRESGIEENDKELLVAMGQLAIQSGQNAYAVDVLSKAAAQQPADTSISNRLALAYMMRGQYDNAISQLTGSQNQDQQTQLLLIDAYLKKGQIGKAKQVLAELEQQYPGSDIILVVAGVIAMQTGDHHGAEQYFQQAIEKNPGLVHPKLYLADLHLLKGRLGKAREIYDRLLVEFPDNIPAYIGLARLEEKQGNLDQALDLMQQANRLDVNHLYPALILGNYYLRRGQADQAVSVLKPAHQVNQDHLQLNLLLSLAHRRAGEPGQAIEMINELLKSYPDSVPLHVELAGAYRDDGKLDQAYRQLLNARRLAPASMGVNRALAILQLQRGNIKAAKDIARQLRSSRDSRAVGDDLLGDIAMSQKRFSEAQQFYDRALQAQASQQTTIKLYRAYMLAGQEQQALELLERWVAQHPDDLDMGLNLASRYNALGQRQAAIAEYQRMLKIQSKHLPSLNNLALLKINDNPAEALQYAEQAHALAPTSPAVQDTLGWVYIKSGRVYDGKQLIEQAMQKLDDPSLQYHLAYALHEQEQSRQARNILVKLLSASQEFPDRQAAQDLLDRIDKN